MKKYRAVIFDLDDTLYPEREYVCSGFRAVTDWVESHLGISAEKTYSELNELFENGNRTDIFNQWLHRHDVQSFEIVQQLVQIYRDHHPVIKPFQGVPELLAELKSRFQLALLSDGSVSRQGKKIAALGLEYFFDAIVFSDEWGQKAWKPNPWIYGVLLERLKVQGSEAIYVGDNPNKDFLGARSAQLHTIRLRIASGLYASVNPPDIHFAPDVEVTSHQELAELLLKEE